MTPFSKTDTPLKHVAVIGSGIAGLSAAWHLTQNPSVQVTLFESDKRLGGHANTVDISVDGKTFAVDTGFLVFNHRTYPGLTSFFKDLGVDTAPSDMGFSVQVGRRLEWAGNSLSSVFTQRKNIWSARFWRMLFDLIRFNKTATNYAYSPPSSSETLGEYLVTNRYSDELRDWYLIPMAAAIWSCPTKAMMAYPMATFARFCHNHGLLQITNRPQWFTVTGGSKNYVHKIEQSLLERGAKILMGEAVTRIERHVSNPMHSAVTVHTAKPHNFDAVVVATHSDQALQMLHEPTRLEQHLLGSIRYQANRAVLHTDASVLPSRPHAWAAWNYQTEAGQVGPNSSRVCLHYLLNKLQPLPLGQASPVIVSLNPIHKIDPAKTLQTFDYEHPVFDAGAIAAQQALSAIQGTGGVWFAGAWTNYGFHEDGFQSGKSAAAAVLDWMAQGVRP